MSTATIPLPESLARLREAARARVQARREAEERRVEDATEASYQALLKAVVEDLGKEILDAAHVDLSRPANLANLSRVHLILTFDEHAPIGLQYHTNQNGWFREPFGRALADLVDDTQPGLWRVHAHGGFYDCHTLGMALMRAWDFAHETPPDDDQEIPF